MKDALKKAVASAAAMALFLGGLSLSAASGSAGPGEAADRLSLSAAENGYAAYIAQYGQVKKAEQTVVIEAESYTAAEMEGLRTHTVEGEDGTFLYTAEEGFVEWTFQVPETALYQIQIRYCAGEGKESAMERNLEIDGRPPFAECDGLTFRRTFAQEAEGEDFRKDSLGNDIRPQLQEVFCATEEYLRDSLGYFAEPLEFYLEQGTHTLRLTSTREPMSIDRITLCRKPELPSYDEYLAAGAFPPATEAAEPVQGERFYRVSDTTIYPISDLTSPMTQPQSASHTLLNTVGAEKWQAAGQWISWEIEVPADGRYVIAPRFRQKILDGMFVTRRLLIDGQVPFREAETIRFDYNSGWQHRALSDEEGNPYLFHLKEGRHVIRMEVVLGDLAPILTDVQASLTSLNQCYRQILMITGAQPDPYRDYGFKALIPDVLEELAVQADSLDRIADRIQELTQGKGLQISLLRKTAYQVRRMAQKPDTIATSFESFKSNLGSLGNWIITNSNQPLEVDYIEVIPEDRTLPKADANFFQKLLFDIQKLVATFSMDYTAVGTTGNGRYDAEEITVWLATGRDQATVIRSMIDDDFSPSTGIPVNLELVAAGTLLPAVLADAGPDVSLFNEGQEPVNYALRNAAVDLTKFEDFETVRSRFFESSLTGFTFNGGVFALPETQQFPMLFYRKDIFEELNLTVPRTWKEFYTVTREIQKQNMQVGISTPYTLYVALMYQNGEELYRDGGAYANIDADQSLSCFREVCNLFTQYQLPLTFDFANRFRTGEMPMGIMDYTLYNQLSVFAPEIKGMWQFVPLPGTPKEDGTVDNTVPVTCLGTMLLKTGRGEDYENQCWEFMKWWTSGEIQARYGKEMESILGPSAKHPTANKEALEQLPWFTEDYQSLMAQAGNTKGIPVLPGSYMLERSMNFAFTKVYNDGTNPVETLNEYVDAVNDELTRKRKEFGLFQQMEEEP